MALAAQLAATSAQLTSRALAGASPSGAYLGLRPVSLGPARAAGKSGATAQRRNAPGAARARMAEEVDMSGEAIAEDYYSILGLTPEATQAEIKTAYYSCMKACHPDLSGNHPDSVAFCTFVNEVYEVLSDPEMRAVYDEIKGYSISAVNPFADISAERIYAFVDEFTCIGCKNCANTAESTFEMEELWGRARVCDQKADHPSKVQEAIDTCPVSCIHWVSAAQLTLLEDEMRRVERVSVGTMMANQGSKGADVFTQASSRWEKRKRIAEEKARIRAMKEQKKGRRGWTDSFWGAEESEEEEAAAEEPAQERPRRSANKERMERAAEAARRWRDFSRSGMDRRRRPLVLGEQKWEESTAPPAAVADQEGIEAAVAAAQAAEEFLEGAANVGVELKGERMEHAPDEDAAVGSGGHK